MKLIKPKSALVVILSSAVIASALIFSLIGYYVYSELREQKSAIACAETLKKLQARMLIKRVALSELSCEVETSGPLKGATVIKGVVTNSSGRPLHSIVVKVKFLDASGASIYEALLQPLEPTFGLHQLGSATMSYLTGMPTNFLAPNISKTFKSIIRNYPKGLLAPPAARPSLRAKKSRWSGRLLGEVISVGI